MPKPIVLDKVVATLRAVADEFPDRVDPRVDRRLPPRYVEHGQPACLVALVLSRLGFTIKQLRQLDREGPHSGAVSEGGTKFADSRNRMLRRIDRDARRLLDEVQGQQDRGGWFTWRNVVSEALDLNDFDRRWLTRDPKRIAPWKLLGAPARPTDKDNEA